MDRVRTGLSEQDILDGRKAFSAFMKALYKMRLSSINKEEHSEPEHDTRQLVRNDDYMEVRLKGGKKIKGENIIKLKTVFHSIEVEIEDYHGGTLKANYNIRKTIDGLHKWLLSNYPDVTVEEIQDYARQNKTSYDEAKKVLAFSIAENEMWIRLDMARFLHEQLEPTLKLVITDLLEDAALFGYSRYGGKLANPKQLEKAAKSYVEMRKKRSKAIRSRGERGKASVSSDDAHEFMLSVMTTMNDLEQAGRNITANAVARKIIGDKHTNPLKAFKDKLAKFNYTFNDLKELYLQSKS